MKNEVTHFVLTRIISNKQNNSANHSVQFWNEALLYSERIHSKLSFLSAIDRSETKQRLPDLIRQTFEIQLTQERMFLGLLDYETSLVLKFLKEENIPVTLLKGIDISRRFYPDRMMRPMKDIDLWVPFDLFNRTVGFLKRKGYRPTTVQNASRFKIELSRKESFAIIEVHGLLLSGDRKDRLQQIWDRAISIEFKDLPGPIRVLSPNDNLVYLIRHAAIQHLLESPVWLKDIHFLITHTKEINWSFVIEEMAYHKGKTAAWFVLKMLHNSFDTPVPLGVIKAIEPSRFSLHYHLLKNVSDPKLWFRPDSKGWLWVACFRFALKDSIWDTVKYTFKRQAIIWSSASKT